MNRYSYVLKIKNAIVPKKIIGLFPYGLLIDPANSSIKNEQLTFFDNSTEFFKKLIEKNISVVLFINQFKKQPASFDELKKFIEAVEGYISQQGVSITGMYWSPGYEKTDPFVVPNPGMFHRVSENTNLVWDNVDVLSDNDDDLLAASEVQATPVYIGKPHVKWQSYNSILDWIDQQQ